MQWAYIRIQVFTPEQVKILKTSRPIMKLVLSTTLLIVQIFISLLSAAPRILHVEEAEPFNPLEQAVVVPLLNYTTAFLPFGIEPELQSTSTWQTIHPTQPWDKITMNATEFTRQWLLQNHPGEWHLRIVEQNQAHPKLHTVLFDGEIQLPPEIVAEIEDRLAFRVYHLVPPQMIFQLACNVFKQNRLKETFEAGEKIFSLLHTGASWFYKAINDVENSMATDGDLGKLRESLLVCDGLLAVFSNWNHGIHYQVPSLLLQYSVFHVLVARSALTWPNNSLDISRSKT